jgi:flavin reductase (DIM6/NTAB) family NADH-FMN oxidoreductase RutF
MTISWLTATNNQGGVFCSVNERRHTAQFLVEGGIFVLNIPVQVCSALAPRRSLAA